MINIVSLTIVTILIPSSIWAIKVIIEAYSTPEPKVFIRNSKGQFMNSTVKMYRPDYKNTFYGHELNYKLIK